MNKIVSATEFKAKCLRIIDDMQKDGIPVTITRRGKPVAELKPKREARKDVFGMLRHPEYRFEDPFSPAFEGPWDAELDGDERQG
ncbi:type II toxin-antitoxin system Phd/YefM family antitoxin [Sphingomonas suaedae]|uniref:Antitoxin n=1 Tax=Sphingomonas suaedae TaxID=2599297 RepID=A0A518RJI9_9SPHN|nr:type II toxin-antitoxin system Phd/YefM family antitoxin [Sphingomonas suaedae]QDX27591.1 type II toxin-antitoxin system Phd/YefM family antitoxin [Sphingomonas suaedae]